MLQDNLYSGEIVVSHVAELGQDILVDREKKSTWTYVGIRVFTLPML